MMNDIKAFTAMAVMLALSACAATDTRRSAGEYVDDTGLTARVKTALIESPSVKARQVDVEANRGVVQLNGFVDSATAKTEATRIAKEIEGVKDVNNNLVVDEKANTVSSTADDGVVTSKVKAALVADPLTKAAQINVETENGIVQLAGFVDSKAEKSRASEIAESVAGVRDVRNDLDVKPSR